MTHNYQSYPLGAWVKQTLIRMTKGNTLYLCRYLVLNGTKKNTVTKAVHHIGFEDAQYSFSDSNRLERIYQSTGNTIYNHKKSKMLAT